MGPGGKLPAREEAPAAAGVKREMCGPEVCGGLVTWGELGHRPCEQGATVWLCVHPWARGSSFVLSSLSSDSLTWTRGPRGPWVLSEVGRNVCAWPPDLGSAALQLCRLGQVW